MLFFPTTSLPRMFGPFQKNPRPGWIQPLSFVDVYSPHKLTAANGLDSHDSTLNSSSPYSRSFDSLGGPGSLWAVCGHPFYSGHSEERRG